MKKRDLIILICGILLQMNVFAVMSCNSLKNSDEKERKEVVNKWEFWIADYPIFSTEQLASSKHVLGGDVKLLLDSINTVYMKREEIVPGDPQTRPVIRKPEIFKAVSVIEKYLKKEVEQKRMNLDLAHEKMLRVAYVALAAIDTSDTDSFEESLYQQRKSAVELLALFGQVKLTSL